jgi:hypothetical protein
MPHVMPNRTALNIWGEQAETRRIGHVVGQGVKIMKMESWAIG